MSNPSRFLLIALFFPPLFAGCGPEGVPKCCLPDGVKIIAERGGGVPSPDMRAIVRVNWRGEFYAADLQSGRRHYLGVWARMPVNPGPGIVMWSPDSKRVAISGWENPSRRRDLSPDMFIFDLSGTKPRRISKFVGTEGLVAWSPDSRFICFGAYYDERHAPFRVAFAETAEMRSLFRSTSERCAVRWLGRKNTGSFRPGNLFQPCVWSPDGHALAGSAGVVVDFSTHITLPALFDLRTRKVTVFGERDVIGPENILGFSPDGRRLYCVFGSSTDLGAKRRGAFFGYVEPFANGGEHLIAFPGYSAQRNSLLCSHDGFEVQQYGASISPDGRFVGIWERRRGSSAFGEPTIRLVVWRLSNPVRREKVFQFDASEPSLLSLVKEPLTVRFSPDGKRGYALFASGAVIEYSLG